jgi:hypothetical protein
MARNECATNPQTGPVCPVCHKPVPEKITRYKVMGIFVPLWKPGSCQNPSCPTNAREEESVRTSGAKR